MMKFIKQFHVQNGYSNVLIAMICCIGIAFLITCGKNYEYAPWSIWMAIGLGFTACIFVPAAINLVQYYKNSEEFNLWEILYSVVGILPGIPAILLTLYFEPTFWEVFFVEIGYVLFWFYVWKLRFVLFKTN
jgi:hypothetical protein